MAVSIFVMGMPNRVCNRCPAAMGCDPCLNLPELVYYSGTTPFAHNSNIYCPASIPVAPSNPSSSSSPLATTLPLASGQPYYLLQLMVIIKHLPLMTTMYQSMKLLTHLFYMFLSRLFISHNNRWIILHCFSFYDVSSSMHMHSSGVENSKTK